MRRLLAVFLLTLLPLPGLRPATSVAAADEVPGVSISISVDRNEVYQGEVVPVTVILKAGGSRLRNIAFPSLQSPRLSPDGFATPEESENAGEDATTTYLFRGRFTARSAGVMTIGPANVTCEVLDDTSASGGFFGTVQPRMVKLTSGTMNLSVQGLPKQHRPATFHGAVGSFAMEVTAKPSSVAAGEPLTVVTTIKGTGDLEAAKCPDLGGASQSYPASARRERGRLTCEQVVVVRPGSQLPPVLWSYFAPEQRAYRTLRQVIPAAVHARRQPTPRLSAPPPVVAASGRSSQPRAHQSARPELLWPLVITLSGAVGISTYRLRRLQKSGPADCLGEQTVSDVVSADAEAAASSGDVDEFYSAAYRALRHAISRETGCDSDTVTSLPESELFIGAVELWDRCQQVLYGKKTVSVEVMSADLQLLLRLL